MSITVTKNGVDISSSIVFPSLTVEQALTNEVDTASFQIRGVDYSLLKEDGGLLLQEDGYKILISDPPAFNDNIVIADGATTIFAGKIGKVQRVIEAPRQILYSISCLEHSFQMDRLLVSRTYTNKTVTYIINDIVSSFAPGFTNVNAACAFTVSKIVFNHVTISECLRRLANIVRYDWYVDENKDVHFFPNTTNVAPFSLDDTTGTHVFKSLVRNADGAQTVNRVKVRGGEYDGTSFTDVITVKGNVTSSFNLPYKMANLAIRLDTGSGYVSKTVGIDFIDTFTDYQVLYSYQTQSFRFASPLADTNKIEFTGNPKTPVVAVVEDPASVATYGPIEKLVKDTSILSNALARKRAAAELMAFASVAVDALFTTYTSGLRTGMLINVNASGLKDALIIKRVAFKARTPLIFEYAVTCISSQRYSLIDLLRKIMTPDPSSSDEQEVAESLFPASDMATMSDTASVVAVVNVPTVLNTLNIAMTGGTNLFAFDCTGATVLILVVPFTSSVTGITYNGVSLTADGTVGSLWGSAVYRLNSPTTGTNNIAILGTSPQIQARAYAITGINTANPIAGSAAQSVNPTESQHISLSVSQPNIGIWSIGFMLRITNDPGAPSRSFAPDTALDIEGYDGQVLGNAQMSHIMHHIFTRPGIKKMGSTYSVGPNNGGNEASFVLYNGLSVT
jgi:hypothetical protein